MSISGKSFTTQIIPLRSVRQFIFDEIVLSECNQVKNLSNKENKRAVASFLIERSETKIAELRTNWLKAHSQDDEYPLPLLRIRVCFLDTRFNFNYLRLNIRAAFKLRTLSA